MRNQEISQKEAHPDWLLLQSISPSVNIDVSSHQIRQWISEEKSLKYYVPDKVISYMKENGIYRKKEV